MNGAGAGTRPVLAVLRDLDVSPRSRPTVPRHRWCRRADGLCGAERPTDAVRGSLVNDPTEPTRDDLAEQVRLLAAENERLRAAPASAAGVGPGVTDPVPLPARRSRGRWGPGAAALPLAT